jgi:hypothetical protein
MIETANANRIPRLFSDIGLVLLSILGGITIGAGFGVLGYFIYLIVLFPLTMGFAGKYVLVENVKFLKASNRRIILFSSLLTAIALYGSFHYMRYFTLQIMTTLQAFGDFSDQSLEAGRVMVDYALKQETGHSGFFGYLLFKANQGASIGRVFSSNRLNLGPILTWVYWLVEFGVIAFITVKGVEQVMKRPFCEFCRSWYPEPGHVGGVPGNKETEVLDLIKHRDFASTGKMLEENPDVPSTDLYLQGCKSCDKSNAFLTVTNVNSVRGRLAFKEMMKTTLAPGENKRFKEEIRFLKTES